ncbi:MAG: adenylate/guanylate cyclase domain-containing protein [Bacteroidales bacterium]|jgi:class 3 adenylate cyclase|nr:adenylate/guanylate cyclase domain-containing protein [Bacteroidales bacterium]
MQRKEFFDSITSVINDWKNTSFTFHSKDYVPGIDDANLTYGNGEEKKGIDINTCVLFVDIRNSVQLTKSTQLRTMGKIYSVFTHCVLLAAQNEGGYVRNIIGDRVMVVFPEKNCYKSAVCCAITINHIAAMINEKFDNIVFKCGIGVDYGKINVMKVGIKKTGAENDDNKELVWVGYPANFASRLTDCANKEFIDVYYEVDGIFYEYNYFEGPFWGRKSDWYRKKVTFSAEDLASNVTFNQADNSLRISSCRQVFSINKIESKYAYKSILLSDKVYQEYIKASPKSNDIIEGLWSRQIRKIRDIDFGVWGANLTWRL